MSVETGFPILDVTRLVSRVGHGPLTGIDRVERAYLREFERRGRGALLAATRYGYLLLPVTAAAPLLSWLQGDAQPPKPALIDRLWRRAPGPAGAEQGLRRLARARFRRRGLTAGLKRHCSGLIRYFNVGHANLRERTLRQIAAIAGSRITVLMHDAIPATRPDLAAPVAVRAFARKLRAVARHATMVVCPSRAGAAEVSAALAASGRCPPVSVAAIGVRPAEPAAPAPAGRPPPRPYFVAIGTIEPRKNQVFLIDLWQELLRGRPPAPVPDLVIIGKFGWNSDVFRDRLDRASDMRGHIRVLTGTDDAQLASLLAGAAGLLAPSLAEGFGLPPAEAAALGVPVMCSDLAVFREILGDYGVYASPADMYPWVNWIRTQTARSGSSGKIIAARRMPTWRDHFDAVLDGAS